jgi:hypothetical protein
VRDVVPRAVLLDPLLKIHKLGLGNEERSQTPAHHTTTPTHASREGDRWIENKDNGREERTSPVIG